MSAFGRKRTLLVPAAVLVESCVRRVVDRMGPDMDSREGLQDTAVTAALASGWLLAEGGRGITLTWGLSIRI